MAGVVRSGLFPARSPKVLRMQRASVLLREGATLSKASQMTGYASEASFSYAFRQWAGVTPGAYRRPLRKESQSQEFGRRACSMDQRELTKTYGT
jgi:AraC-like DNA-binding protein